MRLARSWRFLGQRERVLGSAKRSLHCCAALALALLLLPASSRAHGGPPSALGIVAADPTGEPSLVLLNEGLAILRDERWSFACPRLWGDTDTSADKMPLAMSIDGVDSWIIGADDLYLARDGVLTAQARPDLSRAAIVALAADHGALFGLSVTSLGSSVIRIDDQAKLPLFSSSEFWSALAIDSGRVHLARIATGEVVGLTLDRDGEVLDERRSPIDGALAQIRLRPAAQRLFAVTYDGQQYTLAVLEQTSVRVVLQSAGPIQGPQAGPDGRLWLALDGELMREAGDGFEAVGEARRVTCLGQWGAVPYACVGGDIHRLEDEGLQAHLFQLDHLSAPDPELVAASAERDCEFQWLLYRNDLEASGLEPRDWIDAAAEPADGSVPLDATAPAAPDAGTVEPDEASGSSPGCSAAGTRARSTRWAILWAASLGWLVVRRSRARQRRFTRSRRASARAACARSCPSSRCRDCRWPGARRPDRPTARRIRTAR
jgi:hypothetical protein